MPVVYRIDIQDKQVQQLVGQLRKRLGNLEPLHKAWGLAWMGWVDRNFRRGGSPKWKPLRPNTLAGRRKGGAGAQILRDTGRMAQAAVYTATARELRVGFADKKAVWHHDGTKSYRILPRRKKALAFPVAAGTGNVIRVGKSFRRVVAVDIGTRRARFRTSRGGLSTPRAKTLLVVRRVNHPGLPKRPLLPTRDQVLNEMRLARIAQQYLTLLQHGWDSNIT